MNYFVLSSLVLYIPIRIIGLGISIDFLYDTRDKKFVYFILGWIFWIIGVLFPIFSSILELNSFKELFLVLNAMFAAVGTVFYVSGLLKYYMTVSFKIVIYVIVTFLLITSLLYFYFTYSLSILISSNFLNLAMFSTYIVPPLKKKDFIKYMGKSIRWYYLVIISSLLYLPSSIYISFSGESWGLYDSENILLIIINYLPPIVANVLLIILLVHIEYSTSSKQKFDLKDKYSHNLGNILQVIYSSSDILNLINNLEIGNKEKLELMRIKCKEASQLIKEIRDL
ncbi:MAG: hypothetical protein ACFE9S_01765 [Candidatus Hermodarchaeota archaeon]